MCCSQTMDCGAAITQEQLSTKLVVKGCKPEMVQSALWYKYDLSHATLRRQN